MFADDTAVAIYLNLYRLPTMNKKHGLMVLYQQNGRTCNKVKVYYLLLYILGKNIDPLTKSHLTAMNEMNTTLT
jgi:hypothetical protein